MSQLDCPIPDTSLVKPRGLSDRLFFRVFSGANPIAYAHLSRRSKRRQQSLNSDAQQEEPGVRYCLKIIEVSQNYRNRGVGSALLQEIINFCRDEQVEELYGEAKGDVQLLRQWYRSNGFDLDAVDNIHMSFD